jgi:hypothetical protein
LVPAVSKFVNWCLTPTYEYYDYATKIKSNCEEISQLLFAFLNFFHPFKNVRNRDRMKDDTMDGFD